MQENGQPDPDGVPDPNHPGFDTNGNPLPPGRTTPPVARKPAGPPLPGTNPQPNVPVVPPTTTTTGGGPPGYQALATSLFGAQPNIPNAPAFNYAAFQTPSPFQLPSGQDVLNADPGFGFREQQGIGAILNNKAALGIANSGGTLQDLVDYGQKAASQEYAGAADRAQNVYNMNFNDALQAWLANAGNAFNTYNTNYQTQFQNPYLAAVGQYQQRVGNQAQLFNQQFQTSTA